eukprot:m.146416 g.146416  ORF g.146416 m.146416 type:complete len:94 (-) comp14970_c0_seq3:1512-1793(-)
MTFQIKITNSITGVTNFQAYHQKLLTLRFIMVSTSPRYLSAPYTYEIVKHSHKTIVINGNPAEYLPSAIINRCSCNQKQNTNVSHSSKKYTPA